MARPDAVRLQYPGNAGRLVRPVGEGLFRVVFESQGGCDLSAEELAGSAGDAVEPIVVPHHVVDADLDRHAGFGWPWVPIGAAGRRQQETTGLGQVPEAGERRFVVRQDSGGYVVQLPDVRQIIGIAPGARSVVILQPRGGPEDVQDISEKEDVDSLDRLVPASLAP